MKKTLLKVLTRLSYTLVLILLMNSTESLYSQSKRLVTTPPITPNSRWGGITFNLSTNSNIRIDTLFVSSDNAGAFFDLEIWYRPSPISGPPNASEFISPNPVWIGSTVLTVPANITLAPIPIPGGIIIPANSTFGFYIGNINSVYGGVAYERTSSVNTVTDSNIIITMGPNVGYGWSRSGVGAVNHPRYFSGGVSYISSSTGIIDVSVDSVLSPVSNCSLALSDTIKVLIKNNGLRDISNFPVSYLINSGNVVVDTVRATISPGSSHVHTFDSVLNNQGKGAYSIAVYTGLSNDSFSSNDTVQSLIVNSEYYSSFFPYMNDFEDTTMDWVSYGYNNSWEIGLPNTSYITSSNSGTRSLVTSANSNYNSNEVSYIESPCFDFSNYPINYRNGILFRILFNSEVDEDQLWMESTSDNGKSWSKVVPSTASINFYNNTIDNVWEGFSAGGAGVWLPVLIDVQGLIGSSEVKFRFAFISNDTIQRDGFAIDDFQLGIITNLREQLVNSSVSLVLTPNPTKDLLNMTFENFAKGDYQVSIINARGQVVQEEVLTVGSSLETKTVNVSTLKAGVYFVRTMNGDQISTQKLIIK